MASCPEILKSGVTIMERLQPHDSLERTLRRCYIDAFLEQQVTTWQADQRVLDLGGGKHGGRGSFNLHRLQPRVVHLNLVADKEPDLIGDAQALPFAAATFDAIVCTEVLEHLRQPGQVLQESWRVLREGGVLLGTVPFLVPVHADPDDYARYTASFWRESLTEAGFDEVHVVNQGGFWSVLLDQLRDFLLCGGLHGGGIGRRMLRITLRRIILWGRNRVFSRGGSFVGPLSMLDEKYTTGFGIVARKRTGCRMEPQ